LLAIFCRPLGIFFVAEGFFEKGLRGLGYFYRLFDIALVICEAVALGALYRPEAQKGGILELCGKVALFAVRTASAERGADIATAKDALCVCFAGPPLDFFCWIRNCGETLIFPELLFPFGLRFLEFGIFLCRCSLLQMCWFGWKWFCCSKNCLALAC